MVIASVDSVMVTEIVLTADGARGPADGQLWDSDGVGDSRWQSVFLVAKLPVALAGGGLAEPSAGPDVCHAASRDPRSRGDIRGEATGAVDLRLPSPGEVVGVGGTQPQSKQAGLLFFGGSAQNCGGPYICRSLSHARRSGGLQRWAWHLPGWRRVMKTQSKTTTKNRCVVWALGSSERGNPWGVSCREESPIPLRGDVLERGTWTSLQALFVRFLLRKNMYYIFLGF